MGKSSKAPAPPDPAKTAAAQALANKEAVYESARVNQMRQVTPTGEVSYSGKIGSPGRTQTTTLAPAQRNQLDQKNQLAAALGGLSLDRAGQIDLGRFALPGGAPTLQDTSDVENRQYERAMELMSPEFDRQERRMETNLAQRGIPIGGEAYSDVQGQFDKSRNEAVKGAAFDAMRAGQTEQSRLYGAERGAYGDKLSDQLLERQQPMNELAAILQGSPALSGPQAASPAGYQMGAPDISGMIQNQYQGQMNNYNQQQQQKQSAMGGLFSLGSAALGFSDRRLKENIKPIGEFNGLKWYAYNYIWSPIEQIGVMAQDLIKTNPDAVHVLPSGYMVVDYGRLS